MIKELNENPIAWILHNKLTGYRTQVAFYPGDSHEDNIDVIPLYTAPPKREPLSDKDIGKGFLLTDVWHRYECFIAGVKYAEKHHGIGGGE